MLPPTEWNKYKKQAIKDYKITFKKCKKINKHIYTYLFGGTLIFSSESSGAPNVICRHALRMIWIICCTFGPAISMVTSVSFLPPHRRVHYARPLYNAISPIEKIQQWNWRTLSVPNPPISVKSKKEAVCSTYGKRNQFNSRMI